MHLIHLRYKYSIMYVFGLFCFAFVKDYFCQCFDKVAKASKFFGQFANSCFTEYSWKLGITRAQNFVNTIVMVPGI